MLDGLVTSGDISADIIAILRQLHTEGPTDPAIFEKLAYFKKFHSETFSEYENEISLLSGLFYKPTRANTLISRAYTIISNSIEDEFHNKFTPSQAQIFKHIQSEKYFSFSAPTSSGKSFLLRTLIKNFDKDIAIVVPSRALISEYYLEISPVVRNEVLVLQFVEDIYKSYVKRRIYIVTPERAVELFKYSDEFNIGLILMDEAQISEDPERGIRFDAFFRRSEQVYPTSKKVFAHPFIDNPEAQLEKHQLNNESVAKKYSYNSVGKIFMYAFEDRFYYFSPYRTDLKVKQSNSDVVADVLKGGGSVLIYTSKKSIYDGRFLVDFDRYIGQCPLLADDNAISLIESLRVYIGAEKGSGEKHSNLIDMMLRGIVIHHGSMPLKARLMIERFVKAGFAKICFATSTLSQGINMPFDVVWIDNFYYMDDLSLKNLIGRAGRSNSSAIDFDYGYTIINKRNKKTFIERLTRELPISGSSKIDAPIDEVEVDKKDLVEAIRNGSFNDELHLPESQVERIRDTQDSKDIEIILDSLITGDDLITAEQYYEISDKDRKTLKSAFKNVYISHLRRGTVEKAEAAVLSVSIPILLWRIKGKSFSEIVSLRYSYISKLSERRRLLRRFRQEDISAEEYQETLDKLSINNSPIAFPLPNSQRKGVMLFDRDLKVGDVDYDTLVYDTYDYLDKVISISLADPLCAAFQLHHESTKDSRSKIIQNYIRYGTNDPTEIWLLRYGVDPEDVEWVLPHLESIDADDIKFKDSILDESLERLQSIERYL